MATHKLWNRADVRAEMNRMVKEATDACKTIHAVAGRIAALGKETNYGADAHMAIEALKKRATISTQSKWDSLDTIRAGAGGDFEFDSVANSLSEALKGPMSEDVRCKMREPTRDGGFNLTPASRLPGVWRDYGCSCSISMYNVSGRGTWHSRGCPVRIPGEE